jgi:ribosomal protein S18
LKAGLIGQEDRILSQFVTEMGMIKPRSETGLNRVNQRKVARAIKRARCMGLMPYTYKAETWHIQPQEVRL